LLSDVPIIGLRPGEKLRGIDFLDQWMLGIASTGNPGTLGDRFVGINKNTGEIGGDGMSITPAGSYFGVDINLARGHIRMVSDANSNSRVSTFAGGGSHRDSGLHYVLGDVNFGVDPDVTHIAWGGPTIWGIDVATDSLVLIGGSDGRPSAISGELTTIGPLGVDADGIGGFDTAAIGGGRWRYCGWAVFRACIR
jgi:hypothetical protein